MSDELTKFTRVTEKYNDRAGSSYLPSAELRQDFSDWDAEEVHLRDYLDVIFRRRWLIVSFLMLTFISTLILTLASPKIYKASSSIEVSPQDQNVTKFEEVVATEVRVQEFYQTQVDLLQNNELARRVIETLELAENPVVIETVEGSGNPGLMSRIKTWLKTIISSEKENEHSAEISAEAIKQQHLVKFIEDNLEVSPKRNSMLIGVSFASPDRKLSKNVVNAFVEEFVRWNMDKKLGASQLARDFLMKQIDRSKINLEKAEEDLNRFGKQAGIVSLDAKLNSTYRQLEELNSALAEAETEVIG
ncbi:MAG: Wzz/FepE/Etk N-terminal domain-containing protein, partial [Desulfobacterales bacterium]